MKKKAPKFNQFATSKHQAYFKKQQNIFSRTIANLIQLNSFELFWRHKMSALIWFKKKKNFCLFSRLILSFLIQYEMEDYWVSQNDCVSINANCMHIHVILTLAHRRFCSLSHSADEFYHTVSTPNQQTESKNNP